MAGILNKFHVEHDMHGTRLATRSHLLSNYCTEEAEVEAAVQMLKDDLDACAREMKRLLVLNRRGSLFEGWPSANDELLNS